MAFTMRGFIYKGLVDAIGKMADYWIILNAAGWAEKGILTMEDLQSLSELIDAKNAPPEPDEETLSSPVDGDEELPPIDEGEDGEEELPPIDEGEDGEEELPPIDEGKDEDATAPTDEDEPQDEDDISTGEDEDEPPTDEDKPTDEVVM